MNKQFFILLFLALAAYGQQQERIAIIQTVDDRDSIGISELAHLTDRLRETAVNVLPKQRYGVMTTESIVAFLGSQERAAKECREASCLAELGRKVNADYVAQARIGRFGGNLTIKAELYNVKSGNLVGSFTGNSKDIFGLLTFIDEKAPDLFKKMPNTSGGSKASALVAGGISNLEKAVDYELDERLYLANLSTEPPGAVLSFDGVPSSSCVKTPCKAELREGSIRIIAVLEQYETADTTVLIKQNNQSVAIRLKPSFGVLEIKPAYLDEIGRDRQWDLSINSKPYSLGEVRLSPSRYAVKLNHECYESISFEAGINKGKREVFDMAGNITLKKGGLVLSAERDGEPASEPVFVNGKRVGETPFSGSVPMCAKVEIGDGREAVDVKLKHNEKVKHTHSLYAIKARVGTVQLFTDSRDGKKYRTVEIDNQTWMAENLNYNASGSKCYGNKPANCQKYGRLYNWNTATKACPSGWHLPSKAEWEILTEAVGGERTEGKYLKAVSGWNNNGNGEDKFGFAALPGGYGNSVGYFDSIGYNGNWWSASENISNTAYDRGIYYNSKDADWNYYDKSYLFSVRCVQGSPTTNADERGSYASEPYKSNNEFFLTDKIDGKKYKTVVIGSQTWMAENLNYNISGSKCYNNNLAYCDMYGRLYDWKTAKTVCPKGWHLPSNEEWTTLKNFVGIDAGTKLKATKGWNNYNGGSGNGMDDYGFSVLPGGYGGSGGSFYDVGDFGYWWTATENNASNAYYRSMYYNNANVNSYGNDKSYLFSVRCVQDKA